MPNVRFLNNASGATARARAPLVAAKTLDNLAVRKVGSGAAVLNSFQVEQRGEELRIVDGDGSVYTGRLLAPIAQDKDGSLKLADRAAEQQVFTSGGRGNWRNAQFNATGTNLSLKQNVIITAAFVNGSIVGRAVLADGQNVPLDAAPAPKF